MLNADHSSDGAERERRQQALSAALDGEAGPDLAADGTDGAERLSWLWQHDARSRQDWHTYSLIGDVMRSADMAGDPAHDEAFLQKLRARLEQEPVVLAPAALPQPAAASPQEAQRRRKRAPVRVWAATAAAVAGFAAVGLAFQSLRVGGEPEGVLASAPGLSSGASGTSGAASGPVPASAQSAMLRNEQLDLYLSAHRHFGSPVGPGGLMRSAVPLAPEDR